MVSSEVDILHVWGYWYFSQQSWFQLVLPPAQHFSWYTLHIHWTNRVTIHSLGILFFLFGTSLVTCSVLTGASWPVYSFLKRHVRWSGIPVSFRIFQFIVIHTVKGLGMVNKAEIYVFLELFFFFPPVIQQMLAIWSLFPLPFLKPAWTSGSSQFTSCWNLAWRILSITLLACEMSAIVQ